MQDTSNKDQKAEILVNNMFSSNSLLNINESEQNEKFKQQYKIKEEEILHEDELAQCLTKELLDLIDNDHTEAEENFDALKLNLKPKLSVNSPQFNSSSIQFSYSPSSSFNRNKAKIIPKTPIIGPSHQLNLASQRPVDDYFTIQNGKGGWVCCLCCNFNYENRRVCNICGKVKSHFLKQMSILSKIPSKDMMMSPGSAISSSTFEKSPQFLNFTKKFEKKQENKNLIQREGDWTCYQCKNLNFSFRVVCNRCRLPKINSVQLRMQVPFSNANLKTKSAQQELLNSYFTGATPVNNVNIGNTPKIQDMDIDAELLKLKAKVLKTKINL